MGWEKHRRNVIRGYTVYYKLVKIILYECILYDICIQYFHFVNECRLAFCNLQKMSILMPNYSRLTSGSVSVIYGKLIK